MVSHLFVVFYWCTSQATRWPQPPVANKTIIFSNQQRGRFSYYWMSGLAKYFLKSEDISRLKWDEISGAGWLARMEGKGATEGSICHLRCFCQSYQWLMHFMCILAAFPGLNHLFHYLHMFIRWVTLPQSWLNRRIKPCRAWEFIGISYDW